MIKKLLMLAFLFVFLSNYASCTRKEYLIPPKLATDICDVINTFHHVFYTASEYFQKYCPNIDFGKFLSKNNATLPNPEDFSKN